MQVGIVCTQLSNFYLQKNYSTSVVSYTFHQRFLIPLVVLRLQTARGDFDRYTRQLPHNVANIVSGIGLVRC